MTQTSIETWVWMNKDRDEYVGNDEVFGFDVVSVVTEAEHYGSKEDALAARESVNEEDGEDEIFEGMSLHRCVTTRTEKVS